MKEFIDKLIERFEKQKEESKKLWKEYGLKDDFGKMFAFEDSIKIVKEFAKEYKDKSSIIYDLKAFLKEKFKYNSEQAEIWRDGSDNDSYFRQQKDLYMDRANIYGEVMREIDRLAKEYKVSEMPTCWIPLTKQLPEYGQYVLACVPPKDEINGGHPVVIMEFREDNEPLFYRFVSAWMPLPAPYTEGE